jgi:hypothetical protein
MYFGTINYVHQLIEDDRRDKARAFWEYCYDMEFCVQKADYCASWGVDKETCLLWISEFYAALQDEIKCSREKHTRHTEALK